MDIEMKYPLGKKVLSRLPLGTIKPEGWLLDQLIQQKNGLTGHLDEIWLDVGSESGWLGGDGEKWERGPYYCDGLIPLAYLLNDTYLISKSKKWVEWTINSQDSQGFFGPGDNSDWWPRFVMMKVLIQYYEATEDERILLFLLKYFRYRLANCEIKPLSDWGKARACDEILVMLWLFNKTGESFLIELARKIAGQGIDWSSIFSNFLFTGKTSEYMDWKTVKEKKYTLEERQKLPYFETHVVNIAMGIKHPAIMQQLKGGDYRSILKKGIKALKECHGTANGMFTGDEHLNGRSPSQGTELCSVAEYMYSLEHSIETFGDNYLCDLLEKVAFNALPATITADFCAHQYLQQVNQVLCNTAPRCWYNDGPDANTFGLEPDFGCCTANMHQAWPKYTQSLWMEKADGCEKGLAAISYAPCSVVWDGFDFTVDTGYPFKDIITIKINNNKNFRSMWLRIPEWCTAPVILVNGVPVPSVHVNEGYAKITCPKACDVIKIFLPSAVKLSFWHNNSIAVERGPLLFGLRISARKQIQFERGRFSDFDVYPESAWNYALNISEILSARIEETEIAELPFNGEKPPIILTAKAKRLSEWGMDGNSAADVPVSPVVSCMPEEDVKLIPYGYAILRVAQFPYYI